MQASALSAFCHACAGHTRISWLKEVCNSFYI